MILLSSEQVQQFAIPLVALTMGKEISQPMEDYESDRSLWGLFDKDVLIAICGMGSVLSATKVWLSYFAVHPDYRGQGLGRQALAFVEATAKEQGYEWMYVETYQHPTFEDAIRFYHKAGYVEVGGIADYLDDDSDAIFLRKKL